MQENGVVKSNPKSQSETQLLKQDEQEISENLPTHVSMQLYGLMKSVTKDKITPETVNAACNCASQICKIIDLSIKAEKKK